MSTRPEGFWTLRESCYLFIKLTSLTIMQGNQPTYQTIANTHNNSITWTKQSYHELGKI